MKKDSSEVLGDELAGILYLYSQKNKKRPNNNKTKKENGEKKKKKARGEKFGGRETSKKEETLYRLKKEENKKKSCDGGRKKTEKKTKKNNNSKKSRDAKTCVIPSCLNEQTRLLSQKSLNSRGCPKNLHSSASPLKMFYLMKTAFLRFRAAFCRFLVDTRYYIKTDKKHRDNVTDAIRNRKRWREQRTYCQDGSAGNNKRKRKKKSCFEKEAAEEEEEEEEKEAEKGFGRLSSTGCWRQNRKERQKRGVFHKTDLWRVPSISDSPPRRACQLSPSRATTTSPTTTTTTTTQSTTTEIETSV